MSPAILLLAAMLAPDSARVIDRVDFASRPSMHRHGVRFSHGDIRVRKEEIGAIRLPLSGVRLLPGGRVSARLMTGRDTSKRDAIVLTLATAPDDYGRLQSYRVLLNGVESYRATEFDSGGGFTRSLLFDIEPGRRTVTVEVEADTSSASPVTVSLIRSYEGPCGASSARSRMGLALLTSTGYGYTLDVPTMKSLFALHTRSPYISPEAALVYNFCTRDSAENRNEIHRLAAMAEETGIPLRIAFQFHWGGVPRGVPDGRGGTFTDVPYQMITYDPDDSVDDPGLRRFLGDRYDVRYGLCTPNAWGDNLWLTFNNPLLNEFRRCRLGDVLRAWHAERDRLREAGRDTLLPAEISTGEETVYWAKGVDDSKFTAINGGKPRAHLMADLNPCVIADAARDGVNLDPRDGLDARERWWLHRNLARWQQRIVDWMIADSPPPPVRVTNSGAAFADDLVRRNVFTEPYAMPLFPMQEINWFHPGLEVGYVRDGRSGGEYWSGATMLPWLKKERERGRIALPNLECSVTDGAQILSCLRAAYAYGARFTTVYNWQTQKTATEILSRFANSIDTLIEVGWAPSVNATEASGNAMRRYFAPPDAFGVNCVEVYGEGDFRFTIRDVSPGGIEFASLLCHRPPDGRRVFRLPTMFHQVPGRFYEITVMPQAGGRWMAATDGCMAISLLSDLRLERSRSLLLEDWQDAADILGSLSRRHGRGGGNPWSVKMLRAAVSLFAGGRIREAYRAAVRAEQIMTPAAFEVEAPGGRLHPYPVSLVCSGPPVRVRILSIDKRSAFLSLLSGADETVTMALGERRVTVHLSAGREQRVRIDQRNRPRVSR